MGALIRREQVLNEFSGDGFYTAEDIRKKIRAAPEVRLPMRKSYMERRVGWDGKVAHICTSCEHALQQQIVPTSVRHCWYCGARFVGMRDAVESKDK